MKGITYLLIAVALLLTSCVPMVSSEVNELLNTEWFLVSMNKNTGLVDSSPYLVFDEEYVSGNAGCNTFRGSYQIMGDALSLGPLARTEMYCPEPEGVMDQEERFLEILSSAESFTLDGNNFVVYGGGKQLTFKPREYDHNSVKATVDNPTHTLSPPASQIPLASLTPDLVFPPASWQEYRDQVAGVVIYIPANWLITNVISGEYAIFQSYAIDKYIGGEGFEMGDTKCDLNLNPSTSNRVELIQAWKESTITTILAEEELQLQSGLQAGRFDLNSLGSVRVYAFEFGNELVLLSCFGDFEIVDDIAFGLHQIE